MSHTGISDIRRAERGCVHVWVLLVVMLVGVSANASVERVARVAVEQTLSRSSTVGLYAAEAGIAKARNALRGVSATQDGYASAATFSCDIDGVHVEVTARDLSRGRVLVRSTAIVRPRGKLGLPHRQAIEVELACGAGLPEIVKRHEAKPRF